METILIYKHQRISKAEEVMLQLALTFTKIKYVANDLYNLYY